MQGLTNNIVAKNKDISAIPRDNEARGHFRLCTVPHIKGYVYGLRLFRGRQIFVWPQRETQRTTEQRHFAGVPKQKQDRPIAGWTWNTTYLDGSFPQPEGGGEWGVPNSGYLVFPYKGNGTINGIVGATPPPPIPYLRGWG